MNRLRISHGKRSSLGYTLYISFLLAVLLWGTLVANGALAQTRIAIIPLYTEEGVEAGDGGRQTRHYRRTMGFIENRLVRHGFEVINPFARDASEAEYSRIMERSREDSPSACQEMCKRYAVDAAYIVWLNVKIKQTSDGYCRATARLNGQGYDSAGRSLGAHVSRTYKVTRRECDDAVAEAEKEVGDLVGKALASWDVRRLASSSSGSETKTGSLSRADTSTTRSVMARKSDDVKDLIHVRLEGATEYELTEIFGKVVHTVAGVVEAKRYSASLIPDNPQACYVIWRVRIENTDPFRLQANIMKMIRDILDAGGEIRLRGVSYRYTASEVDLLEGVRPGDSSAREIQFVVDRNQARGRGF